MKILLAMPTIGHVPTKTMKSVIQLMFQRIEAVEYLLQMTENSLVYDARNDMAQLAMDSNMDYVLWVDSDMTFAPDSLQKLLADDRDVVSGLYFKRRGDHAPVIYSHVGEDGTKGVTEIPAELFQVDGCGFGFLLMKVDVIRKVAKEYGLFCHPIPQLGEDLSFCWRWKQIGGEIWCDPSVKCGHLGEYEYTEVDWHGQ